MPNTIIFVAINKETGGIMTGANGQHAFGDAATLRRSLGQNYGWTARQKGVKAKDLYSIHQIDVAMLLPKGDQ